MVNVTESMSSTAHQKNIERAAKSKNPCETLADTLKYTAPNGGEFSFYCRTKADMDTKVLKWAFKLAEKNVSGFYKALKMGWQPKVKQNDHNKSWARYLVALDKNRTPVAYAMFRFDMDYGCGVLYCYEIQIEEPFRRLGLGKFIMHVLERCARHWQMEKLILTVLKNNASSIAFFNSLGFKEDETNPDITENAEYVILSKRTID